MRETHSGGNFGMLAFSDHLHAPKPTVYNTLQERGKSIIGRSFSWSTLLDLFWILIILYNTALIWSFPESTNIMNNESILKWKSQVILMTEWIVHLYSVLCKEKKHFKDLCIKKKKNMLYHYYLEITLEKYFTIKTCQHYWGCTI